MSDQGGSDGSIPDRGPAVFGVTTATLVLASVFVAARLVCRIGIVRRVSWDDYFMILAWLFAFGLSVTILVGTTRGLGRHDVDIPDDHVLPLRKTEYAFSVLYNPALMATKTSILIFYLRLSKDTQQVLRIASWTVLGVVNVAGVILTFMNIFQCRPVQASFNAVDATPKCIPLLTEFICSAPVNVVTDLAILALPIPVLTGMRLPPRQKTILIITFSVGIFVAVVDVVRIYYLQRAITSVPSGPSTDPSAIFGDSAEFPWNASLSLMWSAVEVNVGMTCACVPTLKPLIMKILPAMLVDPDGTRTTTSQTRDREILEASAKQSSTNPSPAPHASADSGLQHPMPAVAPESEQITALDFLTTPDMLRNGNTPAIRHSQHRSTRTESMATVNTIQENAVYFGFVNMKRPRSMLKTSPGDSFRYCTIVVVLFLLWGFSYGLLNTLNNVIATISNMSVAQTLGLTTAYFGGGYFFGPLVVGEWVLRHDEHARFHDTKSRNRGADPVGGFKATFILGICIYGIGTIMFWPSAVLTSFAGFMISNFVVGTGLAIVETAANPFMCLCGPKEYGEMRLCIAQGFQGVATVISNLLAQKVFFVSIDMDESQSSTTLLDVQWTYLAITLLCVGLALFFYYMPLPEVTDAELGRAAHKLPVDSEKRSIGGLQLRTLLIIFAVAAQWTYVAGQECMSIYFRSLITAWLPNETTSRTDAADNTTADSALSDQPPGLTLSVSEYLLIAHTAFAISRFNAAHLAYLAVKHPNNRFIPKPRTFLTISAALSVLFALLAVVLRPTSNPNVLAIPVILFYFAEGPLWPLTFALALRGQGKRTKRASAWLTIGGSGASFWPFVMYAIIQRGDSVRVAFVVVIALLVVTLAYPVLLTVLRDARNLVDPVQKRRLSQGGAGGGMAGGEQVEAGEGSDGPDVEDVDAVVQERRRTASSGTTRFLVPNRNSKPTKKDGSGEATPSAEKDNDGGGQEFLTSAI